MRLLPKPFAIVPPAHYFPPLGRLDPIPRLDPVAIPRKLYAEPIDVDLEAMIATSSVDELMRDVHRKLLAEDARVRRLLPPPPPGHEWRAEIAHDTEHVDTFAMHDTIRLRYRLVAIDSAP